MTPNLLYVSSCRGDSRDYPTRKKGGGEEEGELEKDCDKWQTKGQVNHFYSQGKAVKKDEGRSN